ncbi:hypothetical protein SLS60_011585 [Paraconiothyrium brasiliense]|uniref:RING-type domain-containing protein n=1 Tax=Paraconiothyrium brasiliense TaxID=300254 RepID=A0ABR3QJ63_9PLEO
MADHKAARELCTTFLKEKTEVIDPQDMPILDECPICLDTYVSEQSVRINIEGCKHIFGRSCLTAMLTNNPRLQKKCPLCRTVWMNAPAGASVGAPLSPIRWGSPGSAATPGSSQAQAQRPTRIDFVNLIRPASRPLAVPRSRATGLNGPARSPAGLAPPPSSARPAHALLFGQRNRVINLTDSDGDDDPLESFNSITRDINSVRERARITQRKQAKENKKKSKPATAAQRESPTIKRENGDSNETSRNHSGSSGQDQRDQQTQQQQQAQPTPFPASFWNPPPRARPTPQNIQMLTQQNWGLPTGARNDPPADNSEDATMVSDDEADQDTEQHPPLPRPSRESPAEGHRSFLTSPQTPCLLAPPRSSSLRRNQRSRRDPYPFILSPTPEVNFDAERNPAGRALRDTLLGREKELHEMETRLNAREEMDTSLTAREQVLNSREQRLNARESVLDDRERALAQREEEIRLREEDLTRLDEVRLRQLREFDAMAARHREEMRRSP